MVLPRDLGLISASAMLQFAGVSCRFVIRSLAHVFGVWLVLSSVLYVGLLIKLR